MKKYVVTLLVPAMILIGCNKSDDAAPNIPEKNTMSASLDNTKLNITDAKTMVDSDDKDILDIVGFIDGSIDKFLALGLPYKDMKEGQTYELIKGGDFKGFIYYTSYNDVFGAGPNEAGVAQIVLTRNDLKNRVLEGTFQGTLQLDNNELIVSEGKFLVKY
jgi:uncharacterized lipoprotein NlpE involved in copper resistance